MDGAKSNKPTPPAVPPKTWLDKKENTDSKENNTTPKPAPRKFSGQEVAPITENQIKTQTPTKTDIEEPNSIHEEMSNREVTERPKPKPRFTKEQYQKLQQCLNCADFNRPDIEPILQGENDLKFLDHVELKMRRQTRKEDPETGINEHVFDTIQTLKQQAQERQQLQTKESQPPQTSGVQLRRNRPALRRQRANPDTPPPEITGTENTDAMAHQRRTGSPNETKRIGIYESIDNEAPSQEVNQAQSTFYLNQDGSINSDHAEEKTKKGGLKRKIGMGLDKLKMPNFRNKGKKSPTSSPESKQPNLSAKNISKPTYQEQTPDRELQTKCTQITKNMLALQTLSCLLPKDMEQEITTLATNASSQATTITKGQSDLREGQEQVTVMEEQATSLKEKIGAHLKTKYGLTPTPTTGSTFDLYTSLENANMDVLIADMRELGTSAPKPLIAAINQKMMENQLLIYTDKQKAEPNGLFRVSGKEGKARDLVELFDTTLLSEEVLSDAATLCGIFKKRLLDPPLFTLDTYYGLVKSAAKDDTKEALKKFENFDCKTEKFWQESDQALRKLSPSQKAKLQSAARVMSYALEQAPETPPKNNQAVVARGDLASIFINNFIDKNALLPLESLQLLAKPGMIPSLPEITNEWANMSF